MQTQNIRIQLLVSQIAKYYAMPIYYLAVTYDRAGRFDDAIALFSKTAEIAPDFSRAYDYLGGIYLYEKRDYARALYYYERFLEVQPYSPPADEIRRDIVEIRGTLGRR